MNLETIYFLHIFLIFLIYDYFGVAKRQNRTKIWPKMRAVDSLVLDPVWLEQALAFWAEHLRLAIRCPRIIALAIRYHRLLMA